MGSKVTTWTTVTAMCYDVNGTHGAMVGLLQSACGPSSSLNTPLHTSLLGRAVQSNTPSVCEQHSSVNSTQAAPSETLQGCGWAACRAHISSGPAWQVPLQAVLLLSSPQGARTMHHCCKLHMYLTLEAAHHSSMPSGLYRYWAIARPGALTLGYCMVATGCSSGQQ